MTSGSGTQACTDDRPDPVAAAVLGIVVDVSSELGTSVDPPGVRFNSHLDRDLGLDSPERLGLRLEPVDRCRQIRDLRIPRIG